MPKARIEQYYREVDQAIRTGGSQKESSLRRYFANLIDSYLKAPLSFVDEKLYRNTQGESKYPDGSLLLSGSPVGHWESKDVADDLEAEIEKKFGIGYPQYNILFQTTEKAILYQAPTRKAKGERVMEANVRNWRELEEIILRFVGYETEEVQQFRSALRNFTESVPEISKLLKIIISISAGNSQIADYDTPTQMRIKEAHFNPDFIEKRRIFWENCQQSLNSQTTLQDIDEMIVQHILTENIFNTIFGEAQFHRENNISKEITNIIESFFYEDLRRNTTERLKDYYLAIENEAQQMRIHSQKQRFLKLVYEEFYKAYNPEGADRLGIVYTPTELVQFMLKSVDTLLEKHFDRTLNDSGVKILDPCTGTGTFVCDLIEYLDSQTLENKYQNDIFANEVSILPYYIANLNIEYTYKEKMGRFKTFKNLVFVDTLDNIEGMQMGHLGEAAKNIYGSTGDLFGMTKENARRIQVQNKQEITVIIGNPPYNANQQNENDNNQNRIYPAIDRRIKETYIKESTAQKTKLYDMYARFLRWASDRIGENGMVAFVSNSSFINSRTFDGFRKTVAKEFQEIWVVNLKGDAHTSGERRKQEKGNVFDNKIRVGIAVYFLIRSTDIDKNKIFYHEVEDYLGAEDKKRHLLQNDLKTLSFERIRPDSKGNWIHQTDNDFESLIPVCSKEVKNGKGGNAIFDLFSLGVVTARDEWVYDFDKKNLARKVNFLIDKYNQERIRLKGIKKKDVKDQVEYSIKWTRAVKNDLAKDKVYTFDQQKIIESMYRPFVKKQLYFSKELNEMQYHLRQLFEGENTVIQFSGTSSNKVFSTLAVNYNFNHDCLEKTQCLPLYRYENGEKIENITDWALSVFREQYGSAGVEDSADALTKEKGSARSSTIADLQKIDIFHYVYAVLHDPEYRTKYEQNLKRDFPRIPFYENFWQWAAWGKELMELHLGYETAKPYPLKNPTPTLPKGEGEKTPSPLGRVGVGFKPILKAKKDTGEILITDHYKLIGVPAAAWEYKLGNRSALEWVLEQYKESKPADPTILEKFDNYHFADYQKQVVELLQKVCTVSVETMRLIGEMQKKGSKHHSN